MTLNIKTWKIWLFSGGCILLIGLLYLIDREYLLGSAFVLMGANYIFSSRSDYKKDTETNKTKVSDTDLKSMDTELKNKIAKGKNRSQS